MKRKRYGDNGSPCLRPLDEVKLFPTFPLIDTKDTYFMQDMMRKT